jgi:hypothetical protein
MAVTHSTTVTAANDPSYEVSKNAWNDDHDIDSDGLTFGTGGPTVSAGSGDPEGSVTAEPGSLYMRSTGELYAKKTGSGNTGWARLVTFG